MSFHRELRDAGAAAERAAAELARIDRFTLAPGEQRRQLKRLTSTLPDPTDEWAETPRSVAGLYEGARYVLGEADKLEPALDAEQRKILAEVRAEMHTVEDLLHEAYWRGDVR